MITREFHPGMGKAVADRTILRPGETWGDVADRVALGNTLLDKGCDDYDGFRRHLRAATILMSGRHLQHGDENQPHRNLEVFSNCSTAAASFLLFYLLLNGSGVGRSYDDDMMLVDYDNMPNVRCVLDEGHKDFDFSAHESARDAKHKYGLGENVHWFKVPDSREGWAQAIEKFETMTFAKAYRDDLLVLDFTDVRPKGAPIGGMQNRPSSGPVPLMNAIHKIATLKGAGLPRWFQAMYVDHYLAEPVLVGGARRAARIAVKTWRDKSVLDFIRIKRPVEFLDKSMKQVIAYRTKHGAPFSFLWSSNNSVGVDRDYWRRLALTPDQPGYTDALTRHAREVHQAIAECSYGDGTGEPGLLNIDQLTQKGEPPLEGKFVGSKRYKVASDTQIYLHGLARKASAKKHWTIVNPCGEIPLALYGGYCVIADCVPFHAETLDEAISAVMYAARALIRVNTMDNLYGPETKRTNRVGVGQTGVHEFAWEFFKVGFRDLVNPDFTSYANFAATYTHDVPYKAVIADALTLASAGMRAAAFWEFQGVMSRAAMRSAFEYSDRLGVARPHTVTTIKPAGTTSKLFGLSEGWHLPAMAHYLRWVQFREDDPLVDEYEAQGYPVRRNLQTYRGHAIVGFPTEPTIAGLGMGDSLVLAGDATPEEQYQWLRFGEFFWIEGGSVADYLDAGVPRPGEERHGGQISYTLKYKPEVTSFEEFERTLRENQSTIRACSVMPQADNAAYEYLPEEPINKAEFEARMRAVKQALEEDVDKIHIDCAGGACPVDFNK
jgi:adenosylcobalamin-dependent ribonucleoside-triphosphate reductase